MKDSVSPQALCYLSTDHPIYNGLSLEKLLSYYSQAAGVDHRKDEVFVFFDEIQYVRQWEQHLKTIVDTFPNIKAIAPPLLQDACAMDADHHRDQA